MSEAHIRSGAGNEYDDRVWRIREAAVTAIRELGRLHSAGVLTQEALDVEVARIGKEKLQPHGCDLVVC